MLVDTWNTYGGAWLWISIAAFVALLFSIAGNMRYTYRLHRKLRTLDRSEVGRDAMAALSQRYASGEITEEQFRKVRDEIEDAFKKKPLRSNKTSSSQIGSVPHMT